MENYGRGMKEKNSNWKLGKRREIKAYKLKGKEEEWKKSMPIEK